MGNSIASTVLPRHLVNPDGPQSRRVQTPDMGKKQMAKAAVRESDIQIAALVRESDITPEQIGRALAAAFGSLDMNSQQAADDLEEDDAEVGKWFSGARNAKLWKLMRKRPVRLAVLKALFALDGEVEIVTEIRFKAVNQ